MSSNNSWYDKRDTSKTDYKNYELRLKTFWNWPQNSVVSSGELANAGFYYTGAWDKVICAWCCGSVYNWEKGDTALGEHHRHYPNCKFIKEQMSAVQDIDPTLDSKELRIKQLERELAANKKVLLCKRCKEAQVNILFLPCRHMLHCETCAPLMKNCSLCSEVIDGTITIFYGEFDSDVVRPIQI